MSHPTVFIVKLYRVEWKQITRKKICQLIVRYTVLNTSSNQVHVIISTYISIRMNSPELQCHYENDLKRFTLDRWIYRCMPCMPSQTNFKCKRNMKKKSIKTYFFFILVESAWHSVKNIISNECVTREEKKMALIDGVINISMVFLCVFCATRKCLENKTANCCQTVSSWCCA